MNILNQTPRKHCLNPASLYRTIILIQLIITISVLYKFSTTSINCKCEPPTIKTVVKDKYVYILDYNKAVRQWTDDIYRIGMKHRSSKFYEHDYQTMYGIHLGNSCQVKFPKNNIEIRV